MTYATTMPHVNRSIHSGPHDGRFDSRFHIDTGCGKSVMSWAAWVRDAEQLLKAGANLVSIEPLKVGQFGRGHTLSCSLVVQDVPVVVGKGVYRIDMLVVEGVMFDYTLGSDFTAAHGVVPDLRRGVVTLDLHPGVALVPGARYPPIPRWATQRQGWIHRQRDNVYYVGELMPLPARDLGMAAVA